MGILCAGCGGQDAVEFTGQRAWQYLNAQCDFGPRPPGSAAHNETVRFIAGHLKNQGAHVTLQRFEKRDPYSDRTLELINIIGSFSTEADRRVLLAAHYDTRPWADQEETDSLRLLPIIGANDGASGVAVLLEIADLLGEQTPKGLGVDLVFFDGEDYGKDGDLEHFLLGSKYFAANLGGYRPVCGILLDMVGAKDAQILQEANSLSRAGDLTTELFRRAQELGLDVFVARRGEAVYDDHVPLILAGIPVVDLIEFPYAYWHTLEDTPDKCSPETLRQVGVLLTDFLYNFSF
ncbi:MAG: M28 family peptidase [Candidatus Latescibacterota bacterium]|nr:MAG: M28 family peptidase [Candidatus Latescibacterota bacterium]